MDIVINLLIVVEMLVTNLSVVEVCGIRNYSRTRTVLILALFSLFVVCGSYIFLSGGSQFGNGNGLFSLIGFLYLIPLRLLYRENLTRLTCIMCSSWIYTMMAFVLSVHITGCFGEENFQLRVLLTQTALYLVSVYPFIRWVKKRLLYLLRHISTKINRFLVFTSIGWFAGIIMLNLAFLYPAQSCLRIPALGLVSLNICLSYLMIYRLVKSGQDVTQLQEIAYVDHLTGLRNRARLFIEANTLMGEGHAFALIFMDLNRFKSINDSYGHLAGDQYLCWFAEAAQEKIGNQGCLYRMSGDEFVCLYTGPDTDGCIGRVRELPDSLTLSGRELPFLGCSVGYARYPEDSCSLDELIRRADSAMYGEKRMER